MLTASNNNFPGGRSRKGAIRIMLASREKDRLAHLAAGLRTLAESEIHQAGSKGAVLALLEEGQVDLVVIDEELADMNGLQLARLIARQYPFVDCVLIDDTEQSAFHEKTEGLGVLMQLPSPPEMADAKSIIAHLAAISASRAW